MWRPQCLPVTNAATAVALDVVHVEIGIRMIRLLKTASSWRRFFSSIVLQKS
jgi:hypothetical protein